MTLIVGSRIGTFEIIEPLGAGGMGEVYRARDARLARDVALKVLPASVAFDEEGRARLEREARVLASLNHPNIATLHGVEDSPGGLVLVMELLEGETLADRVALGGRHCASARRWQSASRSPPRSRRRTSTGSSIVI